MWNVGTGSPERLSFCVSRMGQAGVAIDADGEPRFVGMDAIHRTASACWRANIEAKRKALHEAQNDFDAACEAYGAWKRQQREVSNAT